MKVLAFTTLFPNNVMPNHGIFIKERLLRVAARDDCSLKVVAPVPYYPSVAFGWRTLYSKVVRQESMDGVQVYHPRYFITPKILMSMYGMMLFLSVLPHIKQIHQKFDFDLIDSHYVYPDGFAAILLGLYFKKPVIISARGSDINRYKDILIIRRLLKYALRKAHIIIAVSQALKQEMVKMGIPEHKISYQPNGVDGLKFHPIPKKKAREIGNLPLDKKLILSVGSLIPGKGFDLLIRALKILVEDHNETNLHLIIVGEGSYRKDIEKLISLLGLKNYVSLIGAIPHNLLNIYYNAADLFALASIREGWPNVIMESLACGIPVVAADVGGIPEIISSESLGILVKRNDREMVEGISRAIKTEWNSGEIAMYAKQYTWEKTAESICQIFKLVLDDRNTHN